MFSTSTVDDQSSFYLSSMIIEYGNQSWIYLLVRNIYKWDPWSDNSQNWDPIILKENMC